MDHNFHDAYPLQDAVQFAFWDYLTATDGCGFERELPWCSDVGYGDFMLTFGLTPPRGGIGASARAIAALAVLRLLIALVRVRRWAERHAAQSDDDMEQARAAFSADPLGTAWEVWQVLFVLGLTAAVVLARGAATL